MDSAAGLTPSEEKVFQTITALLTDHEFQQAQIEFMEKHCSIFEDTDENKLEYSPLYEEFIKLTEDAIEAHVKEKLEISHDEIEAFYKALKDDPSKIKACEAVNKDTVDHLYTLIDFAKFKQQMLDSKKSGYKTEDTSSEIQNQIKA